MFFYLMINRVFSAVPHCMFKLIEAKWCIYASVI